MHRGVHIHKYKTLNIWIIIAMPAQTSIQIISQIEHKISTWSCSVRGSLPYDTCGRLPSRPVRLEGPFLAHTERICSTNLYFAPLRWAQFDLVHYQFRWSYTAYYLSGWGMVIIRPSGETVFSGLELETDTSSVSPYSARKCPKRWHICHEGR